MRHILFLASMLWFTILASLAHAQIPIINVTASSFQPGNPPEGALDPGPDRWSAFGRGEYIEFEFSGFDTSDHGGPSCECWELQGIELHWFQSATRIQHFEVQTSVSGYEWETYFSGTSRPNKAGPQTYIHFRVYSVRFVRIIGYGTNHPNPKTAQWNSLVSARFFGDADFLGAHGLLSATYRGNTGLYYQNPLTRRIQDATLTTSTPLRANESIEITLSPINPTIRGFEDGTEDLFFATTLTRCIAIAWDSKKPVPFEVQLVNGTRVHTLLEAIQTAKTLRVYPVNLDVEQDPYDDSFRITPHVTAGLAEVYMLNDCFEAPGPLYVRTHTEEGIAASSFQATGPHPPEHSMDGLEETRWSAFGIGEWIQYQVSSTAYRSIGINWFQGRTRTAFFDVEVSLNCDEWYPALIGGQSRRTGHLEWYDFDFPVFGNCIRIVGYGTDHPNAKTAQWNSIVEVVFGTPAADTQESLASR